MFIFIIITEYTIHMVLDQENNTSQVWMREVKSGEAKSTLRDHIDIGIYSGAFESPTGCGIIFHCKRLF